MALFHPLAPTLTGARVTLRPHRASDIDRLAAFYETPRSAHVGGPLPRDRVWRDLGYDVGQWTLLGFGSWAIEERATGDYVGQAGLNLPADFPETEIGWILFEEYEGKGYAQEAAVLARDFAFSAHKMASLVSYIDPDNIRSIRLAERLGAVRDFHAPTPHNDPCLVYRHTR
jgi:RimJ/RimL family protein N-acetyltransferase